MPVYWELWLIKKARWYVRLGELEWSRYTYAREDGNATYRLMGSLQKGQQRGALAQRADGAYVMLVGDFETELNQTQIRKVLGLGKAESAGPQAAQPEDDGWGQSLQALQAAQPPRKVPVVIIKKRRTFTL